MSRRTYAGKLTEENVDETVLLKGWMNRRRDLGDLIFIDLRDQSGLVQLIFNPDSSKDDLALDETLRSEYVIEVTGKIIKREESTYNPKIKTGKIEVTVSELNIINKSKNLPFLIHEAEDVSEELRLKDRYLDLRREDLQKTFKIRNKTKEANQNYLENNELLDMVNTIFIYKTYESTNDD